MRTIGHASWRRCSLRSWSLAQRVRPAVKRGPRRPRSNIARPWRCRTAAIPAAAEQWVKFIDTFKTDSRCDRAFHYLGLCYLKTNQLELARQCFEIVVKHYPKFELLDATYYQPRFHVVQLGSVGQGRAVRRRGRRLPVRHQQVSAERVGRPGPFQSRRVLLPPRQEAGGRGDIRSMLAKFPNDKLAADALYALGVSQEELGQDAEAGKSYEQFLEKYRQNPLAAEVTVRRAALLAQEKKYAEAAALYASVSTKWPQSKLLAVADLAGGKCYYLAGDFAAARKMLEPAVAAGGDRWASRPIGWCAA